jgi:hypothetical protein
MATGGSAFLNIHYWNHRRHFEARLKSYRFIDKYGFLLRESSFSLLKDVCDCGHYSPHYKISVGANGLVLKLCPFHFLIKAGRLSALSGGEKIILDKEGAERLIERTRCE